MNRKRLSLFLLTTGLLFLSGCANRCCYRFPLLSRMRTRIQMMRGWCPCECGQAIEAASSPLMGNPCCGGCPEISCCESPLTMGGPVMQGHTGFEIPEGGPILDIPSSPPMMPIAQDPERLVPQPPPGTQNNGQAQPRPYVP